MAEQTPGGRIHERWGRFRFSVIGQLLAATGHGSAPGAGKARPQRGCGRRWWRFLFTATPFRKMARAAFMPPVNEDARCRLRYSSALPAAKGELAVSRRLPPAPGTTPPQANPSASAF